MKTSSLRHYFAVLIFGFLLSTAFCPNSVAQEVGLYGGSFGEKNIKKWHHNGQGFHNIQTYWGPSHPTVNQYVAFIDQITSQIKSHAKGEMKLLVDVRRAFRSEGVTQTVRRAGWDGYQNYRLEDIEVDDAKLEDLLTKLNDLPGRDQILGLYVADEDVGRYLDVQAVREISSKIKKFITKKKLKLTNKTYANFASTSVLSGENLKHKGYLRYYNNSTDQIKLRDAYNVDGKLSKKYGPRGYGLFGKDVDVVMMNWYEDRGDRPGKVWDGDLGIYGDTILDSQLQRIHNDITHWETKLNHKYQFDVVIGYGKDAKSVDLLIQNIKKPVNKNFKFRTAHTIWFWAWYPYKPFNMKGVGDQWNDPKLAKKHNIEAIVREFHGVDINKEDSDGDGVSTGDERKAGTDPFDYTKQKNR